MRNNGQAMTAGAFLTRVAAFLGWLTIAKMYSLGIHRRTATAEQTVVRPEVAERAVNEPPWDMVVNLVEAPQTLRTTLALSSHEWIQQTLGIACELAGREETR